VHDHRDVVVHIGADIPQKARREDADRPKRDARIVDVLVRVGKGLLSRKHHHVIRRRVARNTRDRVEQREETARRILDGGANIAPVGDVQLEHHELADHLRGGRDELVDENIVIDAVSDRAPDHPDSQSKSSNGGDKVVGADNGGDYRRGNDNAADSKAGHN
jgi:hypothetical protein